MNDASRNTPTKRDRPGRRRWLIALAAVAALIALLVALWDWNWFRGPVERAVQARTGREFHLGHLDVDLGRVTTIRGDDMTLANASWSKTARMASIGRGEIDVRLFPLLAGRVQVPEIRLDRPDLLLETGDRTHPGNWVFDTPGGDGKLPTLGRLRVHAGRMKFIDAAGRTDVEF